MTIAHTRNLLLALVFVPIAAVGALTACSGPDAQEARAALAPGSDLAPSSDLAPRGEVVSGVPVERVIDGDTIKVLLRGQDVTVRLIGIDTPETVKPGSPVDCFGPEASEFAQQMLDGQSVTLEFDAGQGATDKYGRALAYVWLELPGGGLSLFNLNAVAGGYANERQYGATPYAWRPEFAAAQESAQHGDLGMWSACA